MASPTAASGPGTVRTFAGACFQRNSIATVTAATAREARASVSPKASQNAPGGWKILSRPESGALVAIAGYSCPAMMTRPIPASMPSTTETEMARK